MRAQNDQIWGETYRKLVQELGAAWMGEARAEFQANHNLSDADAALVRRYLIAYPADDLQASQVLLRYPHYHPDAVYNDFLRLAELGYIEARSSNVWRVTDNGANVVLSRITILEQHALKHESILNETADDVLTLLDKITADAGALSDGGINESIQWRLHHRFRMGADAPRLARINERIWDYIAFINDNAHYRLDRYAKHAATQGQEIPLLSPLAKELFAAMRYDREYALSRCVQQPVWRVSETMCTSAFDELIGLGWAEPSHNDSFRQTVEGATLFKEVEALTDQRLYGTWANVSDDEYERYLDALHHASALAKKITAERENGQ